MTGQGGPGKTRALVWNTDPDFKQELKKRSPLQLADPNKPACPAKCAGCQYAWKSTPAKHSVAIFFKEPMQISQINLKQIKNSGVILVQFLKWVYPPAGVVAGNVGLTIWNVTDDTSMCQSVLVLRIGPKRSGINLAVPPGYSADNLPSSLQKTATGGVLITMEPSPENLKNYGPYLEWVKFYGRVLYPQNATTYAANRKGGV